MRCSLMPLFLFAVGGFVSDVVAMPQGPVVPGPRYAQSMAYDSARQRVVMFGGNSQLQWPGGVLGDTWEWDGWSWEQRTSPTSPAPRGHAVLAYDSVRGVCVLFGGCQGPAGMSDTWEWDGVNWTQRTPAVAPSPRYHHAMTFDAARGKVVLFGGWTAFADLGETWEWDGVTWQLLSPPVSPSARHGCPMVFETGRGVVTMFGGRSGGAYLAETWEWNGSAWTQRALTLSPPGRYAHGLVYDSLRQRAVLHGGFNGGEFGDTWEWNGSAWAQVAASTSPGPRVWCDGAMIFDGSRGATFLFGGLSAGSVFGNQWKFNGTNWRAALNYVTSPVNGHRYALTAPMTWQQAEAVAIEEGGHLATIRSSQENAWAGGLAANTHMWIGLNDAAVEGSFVWSSGETASFTAWLPGEPNNAGDEDYVDLNTAGWRDTNGLAQLAGLVEHPGTSSPPIAATPIPTVATPSPLTGHTLAALPNNAGMLLFGGQHASSPQPFTYVLNATTWSKQFSLLNPMVRSDHSLTLDPIRQNNVLFGGRNPIALADTWTWQNGQWSYLPLAIAPSPRSHHRMAFDRAAGHALLFGGKDAAGQALGDFWSWNGTSWAQLTPPLLPPARYAHGLAYDELRQRTVLVAGTNGATRLADVWQWDGATWAQAATTAVGPTARESFAFAYDPRAERVVLHGGESGGCVADTWSWGGASWTAHYAASLFPSARTGHALVHDPSANRLVLFGGGCGGNLTNVVWELKLPVFWRHATYGQGCVGTNGTPTLAMASGSTSVIGTTMQFEVANVGWVVSFGFVGYQRETLLGMPLPLPLDIFGLPGCQALNSADLSAALPVPNAQFVSTWAVPLPNQTHLLGAELSFQALCFEPPGYPRWASVSNGLYVRCGSQ